MCLVGPGDHPVEEKEGGDGDGNVLNPQHGGGAETRERGAEQGRERL